MVAGEGRTLGSVGYPCTGPPGLCGLSQQQTGWGPWTLLVLDSCSLRSGLLTVDLLGLGFLILSPGLLSPDHKPGHLRVTSTAPLGFHFPEVLPGTSHISDNCSPWRSPPLGLACICSSSQEHHDFGAFWEQRPVKPVSGLGL